MTRKTAVHNSMVEFNGQVEREEGKSYAVIVLVEILRDHRLVPRERLLEVRVRIT